MSEVNGDEMEAHDEQMGGGMDKEADDDGADDDDGDGDDDDGDGFQGDCLVMDARFDGWLQKKGVTLYYPPTGATHTADDVCEWIVKNEETYKLQPFDTETRTFLLFGSFEFVDDDDEEELEAELEEHGIMSEYTQHNVETFCAVAFTGVPPDAVQDLIQIFKERDDMVATMHISVTQEPDIPDDPIVTKILVGPDDVAYAKWQLDD